MILGQALCFAANFIILGLSPSRGAVLQPMPKPVLGGATLIMFGSVAGAGIGTLTEAGLHRRNVLSVAVSLGLGVPALPNDPPQMPDFLKNIFGPPITIGGLRAILLNLLLPG